MACSSITCKVCSHEEFNTVNKKCVFCGSMDTELDYDFDEMNPNEEMETNCDEDDTRCGDER